MSRRNKVPDTLVNLQHFGCVFHRHMAQMSNREVAQMTEHQTSNRIEKSIELKAPIERVWRALTDHEEFGTWFRVKLDGPFATGQLSTGRMTYPGYEHVKWHATVQQMEEPTLFSFAWHPYAMEPDVDYSKEPPTLVEFRLEPVDGRTRLSVVETGFDHLPKDRQAVAWRMNDRGWSMQVENLRKHVET
jgi:uncharacterized protein YndB with AHSA1/START domain